MISAEEDSNALPEVEPVCAIATECRVPMTTKENEDVAGEGLDDPYIVKNAMAIYSWARFQEGPIKLSDVKEVYMVKMLRRV